MSDERPIVVWGEAILAYDFGPGHPLTPKRFPIGIDLLRHAGADRWAEPREASEAELLRLHTRSYVRQVRAFSDDPWQPGRMGIGSHDVPAFHGMHEAAATVAGGSIDGVRRILDGEASHVFNPGGGLHHAMAAQAAGFCIYNDVALGAAVARDAGHRVLYVDLDVHHGDGTQALFADDPNVLTLSVHETGRTLYPGTGFVEEDGEPGASGSVVNVPLEPGTGDASWVDAVERTVGAIADAWRPTFLVTQHGCDSHAWDPLAHLELTTGAWARVTGFLDALAHRHCDGRWFATGGGGYQAYRVVPRSWGIVWHAQAHRALPATVPAGWHASWAETVVGETHGDELPDRWVDPADVARPEPEPVTVRDREMTDRAIALALARLAGG